MNVDLSCVLRGTGKIMSYLLGGMNAPELYMRNARIGSKGIHSLVGINNIDGEISFDIVKINYLEGKINITDIWASSTIGSYKNSIEYLISISLILNVSILYNSYSIQNDDESCFSVIDAFEMVNLIRMSQCARSIEDGAKTIVDKMCHRG